MYILADIKWNCKNSWFIYEQRRVLKKNFKQKKYICKMYVEYKGFKKVWPTDIQTYRQSDS